MDLGFTPDWDGSRRLRIVRGRPPVRPHVRPPARPVVPVAASPVEAAFAGRDAVRVIRAWRLWARRGDFERSTALRIVRLPDSPELSPGLRGGTFLASDELSAADLAAVALHGGRAQVPLTGVGDVIAVREALQIRAALDLGREPVCASRLLNRLDDWAVEALVRTGATLASGLTTGVRHHRGRFALFAYGVARDERHRRALEMDLATLARTMSPWVSG